MKVKEAKEIIKDAMIVVYAPTDDFEIEEISIEVEEDKPVVYIYIK